MHESPSGAGIDNRWSNRFRPITILTNERKQAHDKPEGPIQLSRIA